MKVKDLTNEYLDLLKRDEKITKKEYDKTIDYIEHSTAIYHGKYIRFPYVPKLYTNEVISEFKNIAETTHTILSKIIKEYLNNSEYRKLFPFSKELEDLILCESGYDQLLPIARVDIFFNEDDYSFKFCEFNADGASAMNEDRELNNAFRNDEIFKEFSKKYDISSYNLFDTWVDAVENIYDTYINKVENPTVAIVDFIESATSEEFKVFKKTFEAHGYQCVIADITKLKYDDGLYAETGERIDIVYRRAVTSELMEKKDKAGAFLEAIRDDKTCIIGAIRTQVIHNKAIYIIMHKPETFAFLKDSEIQFIKNHIPMTYWLKSGKYDIEEIVSKKDDWIIKPDDLYGAVGVYAGVDYPTDEFRKLVEKNTDKGYLLQEYAPMYKTENYIKEKDGSYFFDSFSNMPGLFIYDGKFSGIFARGGRQGLICDAAGGVSFCSMKVDI